jgi:transcriptional regulator with XRE-family HTH domain
MPRQGGWPPTGFAARLKAERQRAGLSQRELAERVGCHIMTISEMERGIGEPAWPLVLACARALGVSCAAFETEAPEEPAAPRGRPRKQAEASEPQTKGKAAGAAGKKRKAK